MKRLFGFTFGLSVALVMLFTSTSSASFTVGLGPGAVPAGVSGGRGGEFLLNFSNGNSSFYTFCIERTETISPQPLIVGSIGPAAIHGGLQGGDPDPISEQTAWLYSQFHAGSLPGYVFTHNAGDVAAVAAATALQAAFWYFEDEYHNAAEKAALAAAAVYNGNDYIALANSNAVAGQFYGVKVLNPIKADGKPGQSLLIVPELSAVAVWSALSLLGLGAYRRMKAS